MYEKILVPIDGSDASTRGLSEAIKLAKNHGSQIRLVHVVNEFIVDFGAGGGVYTGDMIDAIRDRGKAVVRAAEELVRQNGIKPETIMLESLGGPASTLIIAQAKQWPADLIVMGTHGRRGLMRLVMGSDAEDVLRHTLVPILFIHGATVGSKAAVKAEQDSSKEVLYA